MTPFIPVSGGWRDEGNKIEIKADMTLLNLFQLDELKGCGGGCLAGPPISIIHSLFITLCSKSQACFIFFFFFFLPKAQMT